MEHKSILRQTAEELYQKELNALMAAETDPVPTGWRMSPRSVLAYIMGDTTVGGVYITPKYMGNRRLVEIAIATLVTDRALHPGFLNIWQQPSTAIPPRLSKVLPVQRKNRFATPGIMPC